MAKSFGFRRVRHREHGSLSPFIGNDVDLAIKALHQDLHPATVRVVAIMPELTASFGLANQEVKQVAIFYEVEHP